MRTLILGGTGMLGRAVATESRRRGWPALALSHAQADITDAPAMRGWVESFRPQLIVNCAAYTRVDDCETQSERAFAVNGSGVGIAAAAAAAVDARFLQVSSDYVFAGAATHPYGEEAAPGPLSVYGASKLEGERQALGYARSTVVRASWLFGAGGPNFVRTMVRLIEAGKPLAVVADQVGCPTYTPFLARALCDLAARDTTGVVHYRNREPVSWHGFATAIAAEWCGAGAPRIAAITSAEFPRPAQRPAYSVLDVDRFETAAGRRVETWDRGLASYLDLVRDAHS